MIFIISNNANKQAIELNNMSEKFQKSKKNNNTLHGFNRSTLHSFLIEYYTHFDNYYMPLSLTPRGMKLLNDCLNHEVYCANNPLEFVRNFLLESSRLADLDLQLENHSVDYFINNGIVDYPPNQNWDENKVPEFYEKENWIYALSLEEQLFVPSNIDRLREFYLKSPTELALQYRSNPKSLPKDQIERLIHEADHGTLKILEDDEYSNLQPNDPVIVQISNKFSVNIKKGKIFL